MKTKDYLRLAGFIFIVLAALHLIRVWKGWPVQMGDYSVPKGVSWAAVVIGAYLGYWGFRLSK